MLHYNTKRANDKINLIIFCSIKQTEGLHYVHCFLSVILYLIFWCHNKINQCRELLVGSVLAFISMDTNCICYLQKYHHMAAINLTGMDVLIGVILLSTGRKILLLLQTHHEKSQLDSWGIRKFTHCCIPKHQSTYLHYTGNIGHK
jgi:hypothetical protein